MALFDLVAADDLIARKTAGETADCKRGCSWCCHQLVVMTNRADGIRMLDAAYRDFSAEEFAQLELKLREQTEQISRMSHEQAETRRWTCPFLKDGSCSIYDVRPIACRSVSSRDARCCEAMMSAETFEELTAEQQSLATEIGERALALQIEINDQRPITGPVEMRALLVELLDE